MYVLVLSLLALFGNSFAAVTLSQTSYVRFPDAGGNYVINSQTVRDMAFDEYTRFLYIVGRETGMYHVVDLNDPANPVVFTSQLFDIASTGRPLDIELCRGQGFNAIVAVSFDGIDSVSYAGKVGLYHLMSSTSDTVLEPYYNTENTFLVGSHPDNIKFTPDCSKLVVACEGEPREVSNTFNDPEGTIHIMGIPTSNLSLPSDQSIDFNIYNDDNTFIGAAMSRGYRYWLTRDPIVSTNLITFAQNIEPEYVAISKDGTTAYVTVQENNAIVVVNLNAGTIQDIYPMGTKDWNHLSIDVSDQDGGPQCQKANIKSFYQPDKAISFEWFGLPYLLTLDEGQTVDIPGSVGFRDHNRAMSLGWSTGDTTLDADLLNAATLGRLQVSTTEGFPSQPYAFGGRGFSIFNPSNMERIWESGDHLERISRHYLSGTFNGDSSNFGQSPVQQMDASSPLYGPQPSAVAMGQFNGKHTFVIGGGRNGNLYVYTLQPTNGQPQPEFQSVSRSGLTDDIWSTLYVNSQMGDAGITDIKFSQSGTPFVMVLSQTSGSLSVYTMLDTCWPPE